MQNHLAELDGDVLGHLEPHTIIFSCKVSLVADNTRTIVRDILEFAALTTFRGRRGRFLSGCCLGFPGRIRLLLLDWFFSLDLDQIPILEEASVDEGECDLFAFSADCDIDPVVLEL